MSGQQQIQKPKPAPRPKPEPTGAPTVNKSIARKWFPDE